MRIFHIAVVADWDAALSGAPYTTSTRGRTLAEEGFIHASRGDQWQAVRQRWYADATEPLVLLVIDTDLLTSPVLDEAVPGTDETFPHIYGPLDVDAVVETIVLTDPQVPAAPQPLAPQTDVGEGPRSAPNLTASDGGIEAAPVQASFSRLFFEEVFRNLLMASIVLVVVVAATLTGKEIHREWGPILGAALGLVAGVVLVRRVFRRTEE